MPLAMQRRRVAARSCVPRLALVTAAYHALACGFGAPAVPVVEPGAALTACWAMQQASLIVLDTAGDVAALQKQ